MASNRRSSFVPSLLFISLLVTAFVCSPNFAAAQVALSWDENSESDLVGYRLFVRPIYQQYNYASPSYEGSDPFYTIYDLDDTVENCFVVRAYDIDGNESGDSNEVCQQAAVVNADDVDDDGDGFTENQGDCNDADAGVYPNAVDACGDGIDQNCDGTDPLCSADQASFMWDENGEPDLVGYRLYSRQSYQPYDYSSPAYEGIDNFYTIYNLDDTVENCFVVRAYDIDGNESGDSNEVCLTARPTNADDVDDDGDGFTENQGDCNDADPAINPNASDSCGDGVDQNCDGIDPLCPADVDNDGDGFTENQGDCNDTNPGIHPTASDPCGDGIDQNCNGIDPLCPADVDDDGDGYTENQLDCNDADAAIHPNASDPCGDGLDQNCDGFDPLCPVDVDDDGDGFTENQGDCNDTDAAIHPNASDACGDGIDHNCDGIDPLCPADVDDDGDGFTENHGDCNDADAAIHPNASDPCGDGVDQNCDGFDPLCPADVDDDGDGFTENHGDCNDADAAIHPNASDACGDGIDQNCDGIDPLCPADVDDDGDGFTENQGDCNDSDAAIHPTASDACGDSVDQNCDGIDSTCGGVKADAGPDQTVATHEVVTLNGLNSTSSDDSALSYEWKQISGESAVVGPLGLCTGI